MPKGYQGLNGRHMTYDLFFGKISIDHSALELTGG